MLHIVNKKAVAKELYSLLQRNGFYSFDSPEEVLQCCGSNIELVKKAHGDSRELPTSVVFGKEDYQQLMDLAKSLNIKVPDYVWYD